MAYLLLGIITLIVFAALAIPWGRSLLVYSIATWFVLWVAFFLQMERESSPLYDSGIISGGAGLILFILVYIIVIAVRCIAQFIWLKVDAKRNHT